MNRKNATCSEIEPLLVELSDGELSGAFLARATEHVERCESCRDELRRLESSMVVMQRFWKQLSPEGVTLQARSRVSRWGMVQRIAVGAVSAAALFVVGITIFGERPRGWSKGDTPPSSQETAKSSQLDSSQFGHGSGAMEQHDITTLVFQESQAARLRATIDILETQPVLSQEAEKIRHQLATGYPEWDESSMKIQN